MDFSLSGDITFGFSAMEPGEGHFEASARRDDAGVHVWFIRLGRAWIATDWSARGRRTIKGVVATPQ